MKNTFIIIPAYNEAGRIYYVLKNIEDSGILTQINGRLIVVDDGSTDSTYQEAERTSAIVLKHLVNRGQGAALQTGNQYALNHGAEFIMHFDADGQHDINDIKTFISTLEKGNYDIVLGSRFVDSMRQINAGNSQNNLVKILSTIYGGVFLTKDIKISRRIFLVGNFIVNTFLTGVLLTDGHNGLRAFTSTAARRLQLQQDRYAHPTEYISEIKRLLLRYCEIPVKINYDISKKSQGFFDALIILKELLLHKKTKP